MQNKYARIVNFLYGPWFWIIGVFYRTYSANRARLARFKANQGVARLLRVLTVMFFIAWMLIWFFASDTDRSRLTDEVRQTIGGFNPAANPPESPQPAVD
jgi:hypothetical protein